MLVSSKELTNLKLKSIKLEDLKEFASSLDISTKGTAGDLIKRLILSPQTKLDNYIKQKYQSNVSLRRDQFSDTDIVREVSKVGAFNWGVVQGQLDQKIQSGYVRKYFKYEELLAQVSRTLHQEITSYVVATWYNHWTTILIEDHISLHPRVIPTLKNNFGVDIFFDGQPFDLKTTYLPKGYPVDDAINNPQKLAVWMYENQGAQRFGYDNRLFVVLLDKSHPEESWKLKRDFAFVFGEIDKFFDRSNVSTKDEIVFKFKDETYTTISKVLLVVK